MAADWTDALKRARDHAPFLARGLERHEEIARLLTDGAADDALHLAKTAGAGIDMEHQLGEGRLEQPFAVGCDNRVYIGRLTCNRNFTRPVE